MGNENSPNIQRVNPEYAGNTQILEPQKIKTPSTHQKGKQLPPLQIPKLKSIPSLGSSASRLKRKSSMEIFDGVNQDNSQILTIVELDSLYQESNCQINQFFINLQQPLSHLYMQLAKQTLASMNKSYFLGVNEAKLYLSQKVLIANLNIMKVLGQKKMHNFDEQVFKQFNELQKNLVGYLKAKYPRSGQNFVPGDLMKIFKAFNYVQSPQNDIIRRSNHYFGSFNNRQLLKSIKLFLNDIIDQVDLNFPRFQKLLSEKAFSLKSSEQKSVNYKIGRKLPQNISRFVNINSNSLDIKSPQLFRVIIKWVGDMEDFLLNPEQQVNEKETFKVINQDEDHNYVDQITAQQNRDIMEKLIQRLKDQQSSYHQDLDGLRSSLYKFQHNLIKIIEEGELKEKYVPSQDAEIIKFASYNTKFLSWMLAEKLTIVMSKLIKVGRSFTNTKFMAPIDLIKFNVTDLLRALISGSKSDILEVYQNLKKLQADGQIKIIKLKNRLSTPLNDVMIIFTMKNSFLICELQLILAETSQASNMKLKNIQALNHFFYELERSPYGVISQLAVLVGYKDSKIAYDNKINFHNSQIGIPMCEKRHPEKIQNIDDQFEPFICTSCSLYYGRLQNIFIMKKCSLCNNFLCNQCIFRKNPALQASQFRDQVLKHLHRNIQLALEVTKAKQALSNLNANLLYEKAFQKVLLVRDIAKQKKVKRMNHTSFDEYLKGLNLYKDFNLVYGQFDKGQSYLTSLGFIDQREEAIFKFQTVEQFYSSDRYTFQPYDFVLMYNEDLTFSQEKSQAIEKGAYINIFDTNQTLKKGMYTYFSIGKVAIIVGFKSTQAKQHLQIDGVQISQQDLYNKKQFKFKSIDEYLDYQGTINQSKNSNFRLNNLGIFTEHLKFFTTIPWKQQIIELNISKNKLTDIDLVIKNLSHLSRLYASSNFLKKVKIEKEMPNMETLILRENKLISIEGLNKLPRLNRLNICNNQLTQFQALQLQQLRNLDLSYNYYCLINNFLKESKLPKLNILNLENCGSYATIKLEINQLSFPKLKSFSINSSRLPTIQFKSDIVQRLQLSSCQCKQIKYPTNSLNYINASSNLIAQINGLFPKENNFISVADFSYNQIKQIPVMIAKKLKTLNLSGNQISNISSLKQSNCPLLQELNISSNQIVQIPKLSFNSLRKLHMNYNSITNLAQFAQSDLPNLEQIDICGNQSAITTLSRFNLPKIVTINIARLVDIDLSQFSQSKLNELKYLTISQSNMEVLPKFQFPKLQNLTFSTVKAKNINLFSQSKLPELNRLQFTYLNHIQSQYDQNGQIIAKQIKNQQRQSFSIKNFSKLTQIHLSNCSTLNIQNILLESSQNLKTIYIIELMIESLPLINSPTLKSFTLYNSGLKDISRFCKSNLPLLQELYISNNKLESIFQMKFPNLQTLELSYNQIKKIQKMQMKNLITLNITNNKLEQLPIIDAQKLNDFMFDYNPITNIQNLNKSYLPALKNLNLFQYTLKDAKREIPIIKNNKIEYLSISTINFLNLDNLQYFQKVNNMSISELPEVKLFPTLNLKHLKSFTVSNLNLDNWSGLQSCRFQSLTSLSISTTNIVHLKKMFCPSLIQLTISYNDQLLTIDEFFNGGELTEFETLYITYCPKFQLKKQLVMSSIKDFQCHQGSIQSLKSAPKNDKMKTLSLYDCKVKNFEIHQYKRLENLDLSNNQISSIMDINLKPWNNLYSITMLNNKLTALPAFKDFPQLTTITFSDNQIVEADDFFLNSNIKRVNYLYLANNKIKKISGIRNMPNLSYLQLNNNQIQNTQFLGKFQNTSVSSLYLNSNKIKKVVPVKIEANYIYLSNNQIEDMEFVNKGKFPKLNTLDLINNKITKLIPLTDTTPLLSSLEISGNKLTQYQQFFDKPIPSLTYITVSYMPQDQKTKQYFQSKNKDNLTVYASQYFVQEQQQDENNQEN